MRLSSDDVADSTLSALLLVGISTEQQHITRRRYNRLRARAYWMLPTALGPLLRATVSRRQRVEAWATAIDTFARRLQVRTCARFGM